MNDYIDAGACVDLGLPVPKSYQSQSGYVLMCASKGERLTTHLCRYIGIANLHSVVSSIKKIGIEIEVEHSPSYCPRAKKIKPIPVDVVYMTSEQIKAYQEWKKGGDNE